MHTGTTVQQNVFFKNLVPGILLIPLLWCLFKYLSQELNFSDTEKAIAVRYSFKGLLNLPSCGQQAGIE